MTHDPLIDALSALEQAERRIQTAKSLVSEAIIAQGHPSPLGEARVHQFAAQRASGIPCCAEALDDVDPEP